MLHYRLVEKVGAGGMGEVYRAEDTRLGRQVAIKVLPEKLRRDPERLARLEREARLLAALNHPHVATLHGLEEAEDGTRFLVMELVEGETLAARLERGALPLSDLYTLGAQIAEALGAAHERGIVHRDLKPANVMLTGAGVKLLDFGLAREAGTPLSEPHAETRTLATETEPLTREGALVGTFRYMAPEQLEGRTADARCDIWALGALLHEMATGRPAFEGRSPASLIAAILEREPMPLSAARGLAPPVLEHLVASCLTKDPARRRHSARDVALDLRWLAEADAAPGPDSGGSEPAVRRRERRLWAGAVAVLAAVAVSLWVVRPDRGSGAPANRPVRFELVVPTLSWNATESGLALSPQGDAIVYASSPDRTRAPMLWLREFDVLEPRPIEGTEAALSLFWSPDGRRIGYVQDGAIRIVDRAGGPARTLVESGETYGPPSWGPDDTILFAAGGRSGGTAVELLRIPANGGDMTRVGPSSGSVLGYWFPHWLPDGEKFLALTVGAPTEGPPELWMISFDGGEPRRIEGVHSRAEYAAGHLVYWDQGLLVARPFDPGRATFTGDPITLGETTGAHQGRTGMAIFAVARSGRALAYGRTVRTSDLKWFDRTGRVVGALGTAGPYAAFRISPTGERVAVEAENRRSGNLSIWVFDVARGVPTPVVAGPGSDSSAVWSPDGSRLAYTSDGAGSPRIYMRPAEGGGEATLLCCEDKLTSYVVDWSSDGKLLLFESYQANTDLYLVAADGEAGPRLYAGSPGHEVAGRFSPDDRWIAFGSSELGPMEVWVAPLADGKAKRKVSTTGGRDPVWGPDGTELYYTDDESLYAVPFSPESGAIGIAKKLFSLDTPAWIRTFDVAPDGERFLLAVGNRETSRPAITVLLDWSSLAE